MSSKVCQSAFKVINFKDSESIKLVTTSMIIGECTLLIAPIMAT